MLQYCKGKGGSAKSFSDKKQKEDSSRENRNIFNKRIEQALQQKYTDSYKQNHYNNYRNILQSTTKYNISKQNHEQFRKSFKKDQSREDFKQTVHTERYSVSYKRNSMKEQPQQIKQLMLKYYAPEKAKEKREQPKAVQNAQSKQVWFLYGLYQQENSVIKCLKLCKKYNSK